jgi:hypothetical protein
MVISSVSKSPSCDKLVIERFPDIEYSISPIGNYDSGGAVIEFRDVSEQKKMERERLNAILTAEQQSSVQLLLLLSHHELAELI